VKKIALKETTLEASVRIWIVFMETNMTSHIHVVVHLNTYFNCEWQIRPFQADPFLEEKLKNWSKEEKKKKSAVFYKR
jgi:hypothetical protein